MLASTSSRRTTACEWWLAMPLMRKTAPKTSAITPIQSPPTSRAPRSAPTRSTTTAKKTRERERDRDHDELAADARRDHAGDDGRDRPAARSPSPAPSTSAFAIRKKQSAAYGYASVSSTMYDEYASDGIAPAPAAANSAACGRRRIRARKYVGKTTDVITKTSRYLTPEYAVATSWISQTGAVRYGVERVERVRLRRAARRGRSPRSSARAASTRARP